LPPPPPPRLDLVVPHLLRFTLATRSLPDNKNTHTPRSSTYKAYPFSNIVSSHERNPLSNWLTSLQTWLPQIRHIGQYSPSVARHERAQGQPGCAEFFVDVYATFKSVKPNWITCLNLGNHHQYRPLWQLWHWSFMLEQPIKRTDSTWNSRICIIANRLLLTHGSSDSVVFKLLTRQ
jgi:hypothetical protein